MEIYYSDALFFAFVTKDVPIRPELEDMVYSHVHAHKEELQKRLEEQD